MRIEATDVHFHYPGGPAVLRGVDLRVDPGERVVVLGPNGSGKSTLLRLLAGIESPGEGGVALEGRPLRELSPRERARQVALLPQALQAIPPLSVEAFVWGGRYAHRRGFGGGTAEDRAAVLRAMEDAEVVDLRERLLAELSGGQRQRVLVARAFAQQAPVLLVDEPTSFLDPDHQVKVLELLAGHARRGGSVLFVSHEFHHAQQFAARVVLLDEGRITADGRPEEILCEAVLEPVYGDCLRYLPDPDRAPLVVPHWVESDSR